MKNVLKTAAVLLAVLLMSCGAVYAGTSYSIYNVIVARFNGSGYSYYQEKAWTGETGWINSEFVGADYVVDARMEGKYDADWTRDVTDNDARSLPGYYRQTTGMNVRVQFSNDWNTPVMVQVIGTWKSN